MDGYHYIGAPQWILDWIQYGAKVHFKQEPTQIHLQNRVYGAKEHNFIDGEIKRLVKEGSIKEVKQPPKCVMPIQCVPKPNKKLRMVLDCRHVNSFISVPRFSQEGINEVASQLEFDDEKTSVDLENGFQHVGLHESVWTYMGMKWRKSFYVWCVLPFGMAESPYIFKKVLEPVTSYLRDQNFLNMNKHSKIADSTDMLIHTLLDLGWSMNHKKSQLRPSKMCSFIGFNIHSNDSKGVKGPWIEVFPAKIKKTSCSLKVYVSNREKFSF